jgi:hypothetical protein
MSFQQILLIWLVLTVAAAIGGAFSHIMDLRSPKESDSSAHASH